MLQGKVALITGASAGIGKALAEGFARQGAAVGLIARRAERLEALASDIGAAGGAALALPGDITDEAFLESAVDRLLQKFGRLDALVNNAGMGFFGPGPLTPAQFDQVFAVNVRAVYQLSRLALPHLERAGGAIINLGSAATQRPFAGELVYMASKGAVAALTRGMAATWGARGVRINLIQPGVIESEFLEAAGLPAGAAAAMHKASARLNALPATGRAQDVAGAALFLASDQARFITGATL
jgi:NAD(P)-dependent dehydrogenase (short-subunit alcohol dehydrogenase family)